MASRVLMNRRSRLLIGFQRGIEVDNYSAPELVGFRHFGRSTELAWFSFLRRLGSVCWGAMGCKVVVSVLLFLLSCTIFLPIAVIISTPSSTTTLSMRPFLRDSAEGDVFPRKRALLYTARYAPFGFPPPPAMITPPPPGDY